MREMGIIPDRTSDPKGAYRLLEMDGAAILTWGETSQDAALTASRAVLGSHLRAMKRSVTVRATPDPGQNSFWDQASQTSFQDNTIPLDMHIDAYMGFAEAYPDALFLLCQEQAEIGGDSFIVDGQRILRFLASDPDRRDLVRFLWRVSIEQSTPTGMLWRCPVVSRTPGGRITVRRHKHQRLLDNEPANPGHQALLKQWAEITNEAAKTAPRFRVKPGDLLCMDNYRVFHGRDPFSGGNRLMHKVWAWTDMAFAVPDLGPDAGPEPVAAAAAR